MPGQDLMFRCEAKFNSIKIPELTQYYNKIDKRMAWEGSHLFDSIEEFRTYPLKTSIFFYKLYQSNWPSGMKEMLLLTHGVELRGNRYYLIGTSIEHPEFTNPKQSIVNFKVTSNYFEASADGNGVKNTYVVSIPGKGKDAGSLSGSTA